MMTTTGHSQTMRRSIIVIAGILLVALLSLGAIHITQGSTADNRLVQVLDGNGEQHSYPLAENGTHTIETDFGTNTIEIKDGIVTMLSADCPNGDCIEQAAITGPGEMILCLPHQLMVSVADDAAEAEDAGADSRGIDTIAGR